MRITREKDVAEFYKIIIFFHSEIQETGVSFAGEVGMERIQINTISVRLLNQVISFR